MGFETIEVKNKKGIQDIRIPQNLKINDDKVYLKKLGNALFIIPFHQPWENLFNSLDAFTPDFMEDRNQTNDQIRESLD